MDHLIIIPREIWEDVPIKTDHLFVLANFVIVYTKEDQHTSLIMGRPFLSMTGIFMDVQNGRIFFNNLNEA